MLTNFIDVAQAVGILQEILIDLEKGLCEDEADLGPLIKATDILSSQLFSSLVDIRQQFRKQVQICNIIYCSRSLYREGSMQLHIYSETQAWLSLLHIILVTH